MMGVAIKSISLILFLNHEKIRIDDTPLMKIIDFLFNYFDRYQDFIISHLSMRITQD